MLVTRCPSPYDSWTRPFPQGDNCVSAVAASPGTSVEVATAGVMPGLVIRIRQETDR